jgi:long-chain acyl-CoA synthetase
MSLAEADAALTAPGQMFEMAEANVRGIPTRVWKGTPATLADILGSSRGHGEATFLVYEDERYSFEEHFRIAAHLAHILRERYGVREGDRVAVAMRNVPEWSFAFWGASAAGAVVVPLNAWWSAEELDYGLSDSGATVLLCDGERLERLGAVLDRVATLEAVVVARPVAAHPPSPGYAGFWEVLGNVPADVDLPAVRVATDDDATIFYTSGTTGRPKGALGTHRNICTNPLSMIYVNLRTAFRSGTEPSASGQNAYLISVPFFHATGCHSILVTNLVVGGKLVMMHRWDAGRALELIERERITIFGGVPAMVMDVLDHPDIDRRDTSSVRSVGYGGAPAPPDLVRRIKARFPTGSASNGYGLTETSSLTTMNQGDDYVAKPDSVGPPVPVVDVKVVDEHGIDLPTGAVGELWIKGPNVVKGYWNRPDATAETFSEGWLHTGDVARIDEDGWVFIVDRAKDMLIRGGENVYCVEIESVLYEHPAIAEAAIIGVPHPVLGEEVGAIVVRRAGGSVDEAGVRQMVAERLAAFKVPSHVWFVDDPLPRNPAGKVLKRQLRDQMVG